MMLFKRYLVVRFTTAEPEKLLTNLTGVDIELVNIEWIDKLTAEIQINMSQYFAAQRIFEKYGARYHVVGRKGAIWHVLNAFRRPVLLTGLFLFAVMALLLPERILFVEVTGNDNVPEKLIRQCVEDCGLSFGVSASELRSEEIKNGLLGRIPQLQWVGVTTSGCVATVHVRERSSADERPQSDFAVSSIVASHDGIISEMTVYSGNPLFQVGESVRTGDVMISGYTDFGIKTVAQRAAGEVFAHTSRKCSIVTPTWAAVRENYGKEQVCYRLRIGKKVINLCNHSGILDGTCVKMYSEYYWTLPGGFQLPVSLIRVTCVYYDTVDTLLAEESLQWLPQYAREYLLSQMIAGNILDETLDWHASSGLYELTGRYACHEMIGLEKHEEILK